MSGYHGGGGGGGVGPAGPAGPAGAPGAAGSAADIETGTYTPVCSQLVNLDSVVANLAFWTRIKTLVTVWFTFDADPTNGGAGTYTSFEATLPIASDIVADINLMGGGFNYQADQPNVQCGGHIPRNTAEVFWTSMVTAQKHFVCVFSYRILP